LGLNIDTLTAALILLIVITYLLVRIFAFVTAARRDKRERKDN
jgi:hypothetical protein